MQLTFLYGPKEAMTCYSVLELEPVLQHPLLVTKFPQKVAPFSKYT